MKFRVLGCSGAQIPGHHLSSYLVNDSLLVDAGAATFVLGLDAQRKIKNILITHAHLDHVQGLATLVDNLFGQRRSPLRVWGVEDVIAGLKSSLFNDTLWPDFTKITGESQALPVMAFHNLPVEEAVRVGECMITAVRVNHIVPSTAFFIENKKKTLLHVGDSGPTERIWAIAREWKNLSAVVLEASFPDRLERMAAMSQHLTPKSLLQELEKLGRPSVPVLVTHLKPQYRAEIARDLKRVKGYRLRILKEGDTLTF